MSVRASPASTGRAWLFRIGLCALGGVAGVGSAHVAHRPEHPTHERDHDLHCRVMGWAAGDHGAPWRVPIMGPGRLCFHRGLR